MSDHKAASRSNGDTSLPPATSEPVNYGSYLMVPELLDLQRCRVGDESHDELLFIIIHQTYELWFKQILYELDTVARLLREGTLGEAKRLVDRVVEILRVLVSQIHLLETMTPRDFGKFRAALRPASGFQSAQFRELEFLCGMKSKAYLRYYPEGSAERERLEARLDAPSLRDILYDVLRGQGLELPEDPDGLDGEALERSIQELLPVFVHIEEHFALYYLCESLVDLDQWIGLWRHHHVRVVERLIGSKMGTGGSSGVGYLAKTLSKRAFPLLWAVRSRLDDDELYVGDESKRTHLPADD